MMPFDLMPLRAWWLRLTPPRWQPTRSPGESPLKALDPLLSKDGVADARRE